MFGGFAPLPLRCTGSPEEGWGAAQVLRMAADVAAAGRSLPFAWVTVTRGTGGAAPVVTRVSCRAPGLTAVVAGNHPDPIVVTFAAAPEDESAAQHVLTLRQVRASRHDSTDPALASLTTPVSFTIESETGDELNFTAVCYGYWNAARPEDYGGDRNKQDTRTETTPYAWNWYQDVGASLGSSFGTALSGSLHARKIAYARALGAAQRAEERLRCNSTPDTATFALEDWATVLGVPRGANEPAWRVRRNCSVLYAAKNGGSLIGLEQACQDLLGSRYVRIISSDEDDLPDVWPFWYDIGGGVWAEGRRRILVDVRTPGDANDADFQNLVQLHLIRLLDRMTPATVSFDWTATETSGFFLDVSPLDFTGL